jgi:hypothetical protein
MPANIQAFPHIEVAIAPAPDIYHEGMSLRDWFAGQAMQAMVAADGEKTAKAIAQASYWLADCMLHAREA